MFNKICQQANNYINMQERFTVVDIKVGTCLMTTQNISLSE